MSFRCLSVSRPAGVGARIGVAPSHLAKARGFRTQRGESMNRRKPNLFVIGAMKSGTSYLRKLLRAHPDIFMCDPEEPSYFVDPPQLRMVWRDMWRRGLWRSEEQYLELFRPAGDARILGEASTNYTKLPLVTGVCERIGDFNPEARFVYVMRDPVERAISHYWHMVRFHAEHRPIAQAVRQDPQYLTVSDYAMQLRPYLRRFGRDRFAILIHEQLVADPAGQMRDLYRWLGVNPLAADFSRFAEPENVGPDVLRMPGWKGIPRRLGQEPALQIAIEWIPRNVFEVMSQLTTREVRRRTVDATEAVAFLRSQQRRQADELAMLLGMSFPEWTTLYGASVPDVTVEHAAQARPSGRSRSSALS